MLVIRKEQMAVLMNVAHQGFRERLRAFIRDNLGDEFAQFSDVEFDEHICECEDAATTLGIV